MKSAARLANQTRENLNKIPSAFARTVVADYISSLCAEHKKELINLARRIEDSPIPRKGQLIPLEDV